MFRYYTQTQYAELKRLLYEKTFPIEQSFINLALVKEEEQKTKEPEAQDLQSKKKEPESKFRDERINSFEDIHKPKESIQIEQILAQLKDPKAPRRILIEGRAGIGKTTLCQFIANQWAAENGKLRAWRDKFKLLIWLPLRELNGYAEKKYRELSLAQIVYDRYCQYEENISLADITAELEKLHTTQEVLYILDGYDELVPVLQESKHKDFKEFFERKILTLPNWILTSRPLYAANIKADSRLENIGFISADIPIYAQQFFKDIEKENQVEALLKLLVSNKNIHGVAHIPINLELICSVWEQEGATRLGSTLNMTGLYDKLVINLFKRYLHKFHERNLTDLTWEEINSFGSYDCCSMVKFLENLAWRGMQQPSVVLESVIIKQSARELWSNDPKEKYSIAVLKDLGLLKSLGVAKSSILDQEHYFIHLTFQEYFAARYVMNHLDKAAIQDYIRENKFNKRYEIVWWFVAGLLKLNTPNESKQNTLGVPSEKSIASASAATSNEPASLVISTEPGKEKSKLILYFNLLSGKPHSLLLLHEQVLQWRCWDEAGLPDLAQKDLWLKNLFAFIQPRKISFNSYDSVNALLQRCLSQSPLLVQHYGSQLTSPWLDLLGDNEWEVRARASKVLGDLQIKEQWFIESLLACLQDKKKKFQAAELLGALQMKEPKVIEGILAMLQDSDGGVQLKAAEVLGLLQVEESRVIECILALLRHKNKSVQNHIVMVFAVLQVKDQWVIERLLALLQDKDSNIRIKAVEILSVLQVKESRVIEGILALLQDENWLVRVRAVYALGFLRVKEPKVIEGLLTMLQSEFEFDQLGGVQALGNLQVKEPRVIKSILAILQTQYSFVRVTAASVLGFLHVNEPAAIQGLLALLQDKEWQVRAEAANALGVLQVKEPGVIEGILALLEDKEQKVRAKAAEVLGTLQIKEQWIIERLLVLLQDKACEVQAKAAEVLGVLQIKEQWIIERLLALMLDKEVRIRAIQVLQQIISEDELFPHLLNCLNQQPIEFIKWINLSLALKLRLWLQLRQNVSLLADIVCKIIDSDALVYYYDSHLYLDKLASFAMSIDQYQELQKAIDAECLKRKIPIPTQFLRPHGLSAVTNSPIHDPHTEQGATEQSKSNELTTISTTQPSAPFK